MSYEIPDIEARVEELCDAVFRTTEFAIKFGIIKPDNPLLGPNGTKFLKDSLRVLIPIVYQTPHGTLGHRALLNAITGAFMMGCGAAYTEATKTVIFRERASAAGNSSGKTRRAEAEEGWLPHAQKLAITIRGKDKGITQSDLAAEIKSRWTLKIKCPKSQLIQAISQWEREGKLLRRNTR